MLLILLLILLLCGGGWFSYGAYGNNPVYGGGIGVGTIVLIVILFLLFRGGI